MTVATNDHSVQPLLKIDQHELEVDTGIEASELTEIVRLSGIDPHEPAGSRPAALPHAFSTVHYRGQRFKVRRYGRVHDARRHLRRLRQARHLFVPYYGRVGRLLVLKYLDGVQSSDTSDDRNEIVNFHRKLADVECGPVAECETDLWFDELQRSQIFHPSTILQLRCCLAEMIDAHPVRWCLAYKDPQPKNFLRNDDGEFISVDEKHLRFGPYGLCLVRYSLFRQSAELKCMRELFRTNSHGGDFGDPSYRRLLLAYYCLLTLAHKANRYGVCELRKRSDILRYRQLLLHSTRVSCFTYRFETATWSVRQRAFRLASLARRALSADNRNAAVAKT